MRMLGNFCRRSQIGSVALASVFGALVGTGCDDNGEVTRPDELSLAFSFPTDGLTVTSQDDVNSADGIQVNVQVSVTNGDGDDFLLSNSVDIDGSGAPILTQATAAGGAVTFSGYTLPIDDSVTLRVTPAQGGAEIDCSTGENCAEVTIRVVESVCTFFSPTADQVLTTDQYPGAPSDIADPFETDVSVDCSGIEDTDNVALRVNDGSVLVAQPAPGQSTVFRRVTFPRVALAEGTSILTVQPRTDAGGENGVGATTSISVTVDTGRCNVALRPEDGSSILADSDVDLDPANGMQAVIDVVTSCANTSTVELFLRGPGDGDFSALTTAAPSAQPDADGTRFRFDSVSLPESVMPFDVSVVARVTDPEGEDGASIPVSYWVDSVVPVIDFGSPGQGACFGPTADVDSQTDGIQINAFGSVTGAADGSEVWFRAFSESMPSPSCTTDADCSTGTVCREALCRVVGTVSANDFTLAGITLPGGEVTVEYISLDLAGNQSAPIGGSVVVFEQGPTLAITSPVDGAVLGAAEDADPSTTGVQLAGQIAITNEGFASEGSVSISGQAPVMFDPSTAIDGFIALPLSLADGAPSLRAQVRDACGETVTSPTITVSVSSTPAAVAIQAYEPGGFATRTSVDDGGSTQAATLDLDVVIGTGTAERTVTITVSDDVDTSAGRACSGNSTSVDTETVASDAVGFFSAGVSLTEGVNCFAVSSQDEFGTSNAVYVVNRVSTAPGVAFSSPTDGATLNVDSDAMSPDFNADFVLSLDAASAIDGTLTLNFGGTADPVAVFSQTVLAGTTSVSFDDISIPSGAYTVDAVFEDGAGNTSSSSISVTVSGGGREFALSSPRDGELVSRSGDQISVTLTQLNTFQDDCELIVDGVPTGNVFNFDGFSAISFERLESLAAGDRTLTLGATCGTAADQGYSNVVTVDLRDAAPAEPELVDEAADVPGALVYSLDDESPPETIFVSLETSDESSDSGFQRNVSVSIPASGVSSDGWTVTLSVVAVDGGSVDYTRPVGSGDPAIVRFPAVDFGDGDGSATLLVSVTDSLGRTNGDDSGDATPSSATIEVDRTAPLLTQTAPPLAKALFTRDDDEVPDFTTVEISFNYTGEDGQQVTLAIVPAPLDSDPAGVSLSDTVGGGTVSFSEVAFNDGLFTATATAVDAAGNVSSTQYDFEVRSLTPQAEFSLPLGPGLLNSGDDVSADAGFQGAFRVRTNGLLPGSTVRLCSTIDPTGGSGTPCQFGFAAGFDPGSNNTLEGAEAGGPVLQGFVIASGLTSGALEQSALFLGSVDVAQGNQWLHFEVEEPDVDPQVASEFFLFEVDSEPPVVSTITFDSNDPDNDGATLALSASEGTVESTVLETPVTVTVAGAADGQSVEVFSPLAGIDPVGTGTLAAGIASFTVSLPPGSQTLTVRAVDQAGNENNPGSDPGGLAAVTVDFAAPTVVVPDALLDVYSSLNGTIDEGGSGMGDDRLVLLGGVSLSVSVSDDRSLDSAQLVVQSFANETRDTLIEEQTVALSDGASSVAFPTFPFASGPNYLRGILTDAVGNTTTFDTVQPYIVDFRGPTLAIQLRDNLGAEVACPDFAGACAVVTETPAMGTQRAWLDVTQNDLFYEVSECVTFASSGETCPVMTGQLESRIVDAMNSGGPSDTRPFSPVSGGAISIDDTAFTSFSGAASGEIFDPGQVREVRLVATDENGNGSVSNSLFLALGLDGTLITVERLSGGTPTGELLEDNLIYGIAENDSVIANTFEIDFRITVVAVSSQLPDQVVLTATSSSGSNMGSMTVDVSGSGTSTYVADVFDVELATSTGDVDTPNAIQVDVTCAGVPCGERLFSNVLADIDAPTYQFDRCTLCDFGVPFAGDEVALCSTCADLDANEDANIADPASQTAIWNLEADADMNGANGFSTTVARPIRVRVTNAEENPVVELASSQGSLSGSQVIGTNCVGEEVCFATFTNLGVPTLANGLTHDIGVTFVDRAGNQAEPEVPRTAETEIIFATTDVTRPDSVSPTACIGESTTPTAIADPASDPATFEDPSCAATCTTTGLCSRRDGDVSVSFTAAADDGSSGDRVSSYSVHAVPLGVDVSSTTYTSCSDVTLDGPFEQSVMVTPSVDPGDQETATFSGLSLTRSYCFFVEAIDDLGNSSLIGGFASERVLPWLTDVPGQVGVADVVALDPLDPDYAIAAAYAFDDAQSGSDLTRELINLGDIDGDALDDLAAVRRTPTDGQEVWIFLSRDTDLSTPSVIIDQPFGANPGFGFQIRAADFDNDGLNDVVVSAPFKTGTTGGLYLWWGTDTLGIRRDARIIADDPDLPSPNPDISILGSGAPDLGYGYGVALGQVDATAGADLLFTSHNFSTGSTVYGVSGGSRDRLGWVAPSMGSPATPVVLNWDRVNLFTGAPAEPVNRADFRINPKPAPSPVGFLETIDVGDFNGDGTFELVALDERGTHADGVCAACGEGYVYDVTSISGEYTPSLSGSAVVEGGALLNVLRFRDRIADNDEWGQQYAVVPNPSGTGPDWLLVSHFRNSEVVVFRGSVSGLTPNAIPPGGLSLDAYTILTGTDDFAISQSFGVEVCSAFDPGTGQNDVYIASRELTDSTERVGVFQFVWDPDESALEARSVLPGRLDFGFRCVDLGNYVTTTRGGLLVGVGADGAGMVMR